VSELSDEEANKLLVWVQNLLWNGMISNQEKLKWIKNKLKQP